MTNMYACIIINWDSRSFQILVKYLVVGCKYFWIHVGLYTLHIKEMLPCNCVDENDSHNHPNAMLWREKEITENSGILPGFEPTTFIFLDFLWISFSLQSIALVASLRRIHNHLPWKGISIYSQLYVWLIYRMPPASMAKMGWLCWRPVR